MWERYENAGSGKGYAPANKKSARRSVLAVITGVLHHLTTSLRQHDLRQVQRVWGQSPLSILSDSPSDVLNVDKTAGAVKEKYACY
jgi:hypothetical protein